MAVGAAWGQVGSAAVVTSMAKGALHMLYIAKIKMAALMIVVMLLITGSLTTAYLLAQAETGQSATNPAGAGSVVHRGAGRAQTEPATTSAAPSTQVASKDGGKVGDTLTARLSPNTTASLLGVSDNTDVDKKRWWRADGSPMTSPPYASIPNRLGADAIELPIRVTGTDPAGRPWNALNMKWSASNMALGLTGRRKDGRMMPGEFVLLGQVRAGQQTTTLTLRFASRPYKKILTLAVDGTTPVEKATVSGLGEVQLSNPRDIDGHATVTAKIPDPPEGLSVIVVAGSSNHKVVVPLSSPGLHDDQPHDVQFASPLQSAGTPNGVHEFYLETRDESESVEFRDIALSPDVHSTPTVVVHDGQ
jgi:hypothetical protein